MSTQSSELDVVKNRALKKAFKDIPDIAKKRTGIQLEPDEEGRLEICYDVKLTSLSDDIFSFKEMPLRNIPSWSEIFMHEAFTKYEEILRNNGWAISMVAINSENSTLRIALTPQ